MTSTAIDTDIVIIGAGIAGLWLHHRLNQLGYHALLLEAHQIGHAQTLAAQGIIHGGSKYALNGVLSNAAQAISAMPARWQACFHGSGEINLSQAKILADHQLLWSTQRLSSKLVSFFASKALQSRMQAIPKSARNGIFADPGFKGALYALDEPVVDVPSLLGCFQQNYGHRILHTGAATLKFIREGQGIHRLAIGDTLQIKAQHFIVTAGEGTGELLSHHHIQRPEMQLRPLQMLLCKSADPSSPLPAIYAHSLGSGSKPIATITSHSDQHGNMVWYLGGNIAEQGVGKSPDKLIREAQALLKQIMPWVSLPDLDWATVNINRAEPKQKGFSRPDSAFVESHDNLHIAWPTKLALAPDLSDQLISTLQNASTNQHSYPEVTVLPQATVATPLWDRAFS
ncbi:glycerol-3-phosphate dehydrogenase [Methylophaga frappieri]|uniref:Glycerol-3-phosphate dehydrogenase n=1 Tax=Methylophaga frappieri (strain ATCC BAA-2434 / DSM 25690 / JAM7) TaxID=754477 RepID=I1YKD9_METFJ|nr:FAD-dependent oxidoreductase [Methylophaga frappieri]AFJ03382.1 glycerol-3-phosphate dehydrogenase [Methylophaga frappieri]